MARTIKPLTDTEIRQAKPDPRKKVNKLFDGGGLFLLLDKSGQKKWMLKFRFNGKEGLKTLGSYPAMTLKDARIIRDEIKLEIKRGIHPTAHTAQSSGDTFREVGEEYMSRAGERLSPSYQEKKLRYLEKDVYPYLGHRPLKEINHQEILGVIKRIEQRGAIESAHRVLNMVEHIFKYGVTFGKAERNPIADIDKKFALKTPNENHRAALTDSKEVGALLRSIEGYRGEPQTIVALQIMPYLAARPGNIRAMEWKELDFERKEWIIPAEKMKMKVKHIIPLPDEVIELLKDLFHLTGKSRYCFPSSRTMERPISENTLNAALRRMGYTKEEQTAHGFRATFCTLAHERMEEHGCSSLAIEAFLAHAERNSVKAAYNHAEYLPERRKLSEWWAKFLSRLKAEV